MSYRVEVTAGIAELTLSRPHKRNALNAEFWQQFTATIEQLDSSGEVQVLILRGEGEHFSSGMDLEVFAKPDPSLFGGEAGRRAEAMRRLVLQLQGCINALEQARFPVLAAIQGGCIGGALDLVCAADCRYATQDAFFQVKETAIGMVADLGTLQRLPQLIPQGIARELCYTARRFSATEAQQWGLINNCYSSEQAMLEEVRQVAKDIASHSPLVQTGVKQMLNYSRDHSLSDSLNYMATWQAAMLQPSDMMAAATKASYQPLRQVQAPLAKSN